MKPEEINKRFTYHPPFGTQTARYTWLRDGARDFAHLINQLTPESREQSLAITALEECVMRANSAIACNEIDQAPEITTVTDSKGLVWKTVDEQASQPEIVKITDLGESDVDLEKKLKEAWAKIDQTQASQPEQRGHAPAPTTWHIDLTNMDSLAPAPLVDVIFDHSIPQD